MITDLINRLQTKTPSETRTIEEIAQPSKDQDAKTKDHVGRIQAVFDSLAVRLCDDAKFATKVQDARHDQTHSHTTAIKESLDPKLRDQDDQTISQSDAVLRRMHRLSLLGQTERKLGYVLGRATAKITERCLQTRIFKLRLGKVHSPRVSFDSPAPHSSEQSNDQHSVPPGAY